MMAIKQWSLTGCLIVVGFLSISFSQTPEPANPQSATEVVRVTTNLVQVDAVVTDKDGKPVTTLGPEDFQIFEDGKPQKITSFSFVSSQNQTSQSANNTRSEAPKPFAPPTRASVRRTIVFVVDDLGISLSGLEGVKRALRTFVNEQMRPGDLVAITRTRDGSGALYKLTEDPRQLNAGIDHLRWQCPNRAGTVSLRVSPCAPSLSQYLGSLDQTIDSLRYIVSGLKTMPGRKALVFFSGSFATQPDAENLRIGATPNRSMQTIDSLSPRSETDESRTNNRDVTTTQELHRDLVQLSNEASVVIYGIDANGLMTINPRADESSAAVKAAAPDPLTNAIYGNLLSFRSNIVRGTQQGLRDLAENTGGRAFFNNNDFVNATKRINDELSGYYLIGYRPSNETFTKHNGRLQYHSITVKLLRNDLSARSRKGFYGAPDATRLPVAPQTREAQMTAAVESPFAATDVRLRLTPLFENTPQGSFVRTLIHIDARDLTFSEQTDGWHQTTFDVLASSYNDSGLIADYLARTETIRARGNTYAKLLRYGLNYSLLLPIRKPGPYQMRAALRDVATNHVGSAYQFVEVPDLKKGKLMLSGIALNSAVANLSTLSSSSAVFNAGDEKNEAQPTPAVRRFKAGMMLNYAYVIYNAIPDRRTGLPQATAKVRVFHDGEIIAEQEDLPVDSRNMQTDPRRIRAAGKLRLDDQLPAGQYVLQIVITDPLPKGGPVTSSQWIEFEIVN